MYNKVVLYSDKIVLNTKDTIEAFSDNLKYKNIPLFHKKKELLRLGFDPSQFFYDLKTRDEKRKELFLKAKDILIITCTRVTKEKNIENLIDIISKLIEEDNYNIKYLLIGFGDDNYSRILRKYIKTKKNNQNFILLPFMNHEEVNKYYCASDIGVWPRAAISIQESMGTGLPIITPRRETISHIIKDNVNGILYKKHLSIKIKKMLGLINDLYSPLFKDKRNILAKKNAEYLSYDVISMELIK